jgi:hypothetical protein
LLEVTNNSFINFYNAQTPNMYPPTTPQVQIFGELANSKSGLTPAPADSGSAARNSVGLPEMAREFKRVSPIRRCR